MIRIIDLLTMSDFVVVITDRLDAVRAVGVGKSLKEAHNNVIRCAYQESFRTHVLSTLLGNEEGFLVGCEVVKHSSGSEMHAKYRAALLNSIIAASKAYEEASDE